MPELAACGAFENDIHFELERLTSATSLELKHSSQIKAKLFAGLFMVMTTKRLRSVSRYDLTSGSHNIGFFCIVCVFCYLS